VQTDLQFTRVETQCGSDTYWKERARMDSEIVDLAEKIQDRIVKLRDSL